MELMIMSVEQQRKAVLYTVNFLISEIESLKLTLKIGRHAEPVEIQLNRRLAELEDDLEVFEKINGEINI